MPKLFRGNLLLTSLGDSLWNFVALYTYVFIVTTMLNALWINNASSTIIYTYKTCCNILYILGFCEFNSKKTGSLCIMGCFVEFKILKDLLLCNKLWPIISNQINGILYVIWCNNVKYSARNIWKINWFKLNLLGNLNIECWKQVHPFIILQIIKHVG